jgi:hypothetical protein
VGAREEHEAPAAPARAVAAEGLRLVREQVEHPAGRGHGVDAVPRQGACLARLHRHAEEGAVAHPLERVRRVARDAGDERGRQRRLRRDDDVPRADPVPAVLDDQVCAVAADGADPTRGPRPRAEPAPQLGREHAGAAAEVAGDERPLPAPHEREKAGAASRRQVAELGGRAMRGAREDRLDGRRQRPEEVRERPVVLESHDARPEIARCLAGPRRRQPPPARDGPLDAHAGHGERHALARRQRQPEGIRLRPATGDQPRAEGDPHHAAGDRDRLQPALASHRAHQRPGCRKEVRAEVEPVRTAWLRAQPSAQPVVGLEQHHVALAQPPRRREAGDAAADDDHLSGFVAVHGPSVTWPLAPR